MIGFPDPDPRRIYEFIRGNLKDAESRETMFPVEYMFKDNVPDDARRAASIPSPSRWARWTSSASSAASIGVRGPSRPAGAARAPGPLHPVDHVDPNDSIGRRPQDPPAHDEFGIRAVGTFPAGCIPQVPINDAKMYPVYATCVELGIPIFICAGIPGPRVPSRASTSSCSTGLLRLPRAHDRDPPRLPSRGPTWR